jgi:hypothetical protein
MVTAASQKVSTLNQIDSLLAEVARARGASSYDDLSGGLSDAEMQSIATRLMAAIVRLTAPDSVYLKRAAALSGHHGHVVLNLGGILQALRADVEAGYLESLTELVHADLFADFLEMASDLQDKGYKDAAAVISGSTLEEHLRKLAGRSGISIDKADGTPKKADMLNAELAAGGVYNKLQQKSITAWLDLRNKAAHSEYGEYDHAQVAAVIRDTRDFLVRYPA